MAYPNHADTEIAFDHIAGTDYNVLAARLRRSLGVMNAVTVGTPSPGLVNAFEAAGIALETIEPKDASASGRTWDVALLLGSLGRLQPVDAEHLLDDLAGVVDRIVFAVPVGGAESVGEVASRPFPSWIATFAERGFYRRLDVDLEPAGGHSALLERRDPTPRDLAYAYEVALDSALSDLETSRSRLLQLEGAEGVPSALETISMQRQQIDRLRHQVLVNRDRELNLESQLTRLRLDRDKTAADLRAVLASTSWRIGRSVVIPAHRLRSAANRHR